MKKINIIFSSIIATSLLLHNNVTLAEGDIQSDMSSLIGTTDKENTPINPKYLLEDKTADKTDQQDPKINTTPVNADQNSLKLLSQKPSDQVSSTDITKAQFENNRSLIEQLSKKIDQQNQIFDADYRSFNADYDASWPDVNAINARNKAFPYASRRTIQDIRKQLTSSYRKGKNLISSQKPIDRQNEIMDNLIDAQLGNAFGRDSGSNEVCMKLTSDAQSQLKNDINTQINQIFQNDVATLYKNTPSQKQAMEVLLVTNPTPAEALLQAKILGKMSDMLMNKISQGQAIDATFETTFDEQGNYTSSLNHQGVTTKTTINPSGKISAQTIQIDADPTITDSKITTFKTIYDQNGKTTTTMQIGDTDEQDSEVNTADIDDFVRSAVTAKMFIKAVLYSFKQIVPNAFSLLHILPHQDLLSLIVGSIGIIAIKGISMAVLGHSYKDPSVRSAVNRMLDYTVSDRRGWMSSDPNRVFKKGNFISNLLNKCTGKGAEAPDPQEDYYTCMDMIIEYVHPKTGGNLKLGSPQQ